MKNSADIVVFTDGASSGNPGPGGWAAVIAFLDREEVVELGNASPYTTNNQMELSAAIGALSYIKDIAGSIIVYTDSKYVSTGIQEWVPVWQERGWTTTAKKEVRNQDLWQALALLVEKRKGKGPLFWRLVAGHEGVGPNERADEIATTFVANEKPDLFNGAMKDYSIDMRPFGNIVLEDSRTLLGLDRPRAKSASKKSSQKPYSYVSMVGGKIVTHATWEECKVRVNGVSGARFKKAFSAEDEKKVISEYKSL